MEKKINFMVNVGYYLTISVMIIWGVQYLLPMVMPFLIAFLVAGILNRPVRKVSVKKPAIQKPAAVSLTAGVYIFLVFLMIIIGSKVTGLLGGLLVKLPDVYIREILPWLNEVIDKIISIFARGDKTTISMLDKSLNELTQNLGQWVSQVSVNALSFVSGYVAGIPGLVAKTIITVVATFFFSADYDRIVGAVEGIIPEKWKSCYKKMKMYSLSVIGVYIRAYILLMAITFVELSAGLLLMRVPHAVLIALAIAVFDMLPVLGTGGILIPWGIVMAVRGDLKTAAGMLILYLVTTAVRNILEPGLVGKQIGLHPLAALIAMFMGLKLFGLAGMIGLPVCLSVIVIAHRREE
ncbi:sporulation integral membrane protein YtvI [Ruminococcus sp. OA3]|uniref:sporulation integral membrane protein YtvI n=1 Tax=Ruminococcus sp. OA3 TaxID=2914164 RepID=UPI001F068685|nr:sporulation integral membrane protein YtvI [Ruminococcus sp. OA3]MCH1982002.1 sporulation integral membrane protein YtvI [Ruminococcus sp. OA3]